MKTGLQSLDIRRLLHEGELKPTIIMFCSAVLLTLHRYVGSMEFARRTFTPCDGITASLFMFASAGVLLGLIPMSIVLFVFKEEVRGYGLRLGDWKTGACLVGLFAPVITLLLLYPASLTSEMRAFYPFAPEASQSLRSFLVLEVSRGVLFYVAWEFFFRGFMLFGLREYVGDWMAICIQMVPQCLWHIGMPTGAYCLASWPCVRDPFSGLFCCITSSASVSMR
jgi:hypothetical protein